MSDPDVAEAIERLAIAVENMQPNTSVAAALHMIAEQFERFNDMYSRAGEDE